MMNEYATKDLHFASYLRLKGAELLRVERRPSEYSDKLPVFFVFADKEKCKQLDKKFWEEGDFINVKEYIGMIREMRARTSSVETIV